MVRSTVCLEGYRISKDGRCIKDKAYKVVVTNVKTKAKKAPRAATVCLEGYKISKDGRCIKDKNYKVVVLPKAKRAPIAATVCFEGYKISKDGRCIKDKNYKVVVLPESHPTPIVTEPTEILQIEPKNPINEFNKKISDFLASTKKRLDNGEIIPGSPEWNRVQGIINEMKIYYNKVM